MARTAAILIIGNEILSGKIKDENSPHLARELRALGVDLRSIEVVPDDVGLISDRVSAFSRAYDFVFTSGGVGPTHDDVTMRGVARALGLGTVVNEKMAEFLTEKCGVGGQEAVMKMAEVPEGAELIEVEDMRFPPVRVKNVYVFPGVPEYLRQKFEAIKERFRGEPFRLRRVFVNEEEFCIARHVDRVDEAFPEVMIGSYPKLNESDHKVVLTLEATDKKMLDKAVEMLVDCLPAESVVRTE
jgi:molybdenum cofactor synthesis domain-containing protein